MMEIFNVAGILIEVRLIEVWETNGPPHDELKTSFTALVEGEYVSWSTSMPLNDFATQQEMKELFEKECAKYAFLQRPTKEKD